MPRPPRALSRRVMLAIDRMPFLILASCKLVTWRMECEVPHAMAHVARALRGHSTARLPHGSAVARARIAHDQTAHAAVVARPSHDPPSIEKLTIAQPARRADFFTLVLDAIHSALLAVLIVLGKEWCMELARDGESAHVLAP